MELNLLSQCLILAAGDRHVQVETIILDFSKAYDKVPPLKLIQKLEAYGIDTHEVGYSYSVTPRLVGHP